MADSSTTQSAPKLPVNVCHLRGRIKIIEKTKQAFATFIVLPATDEWTSPQTVKVLSKNRLGEKEDVITVVARPCGYHRVNIGKRPGPDGELPSFNNCDGYFSAIE